MMVVVKIPVENFPHSELAEHGMGNAKAIQGAVSPTGQGSIQIFGTFLPPAQDSRSPLFRGVLLAS